MSPGAIIRNSALGWWGAYLINPSSPSRVIVPSEWVSEDANGQQQYRKAEDLYPPNWTVI